MIKTPKTDSSVRKVFLPKTVAYQLIEWRKEQEKLKDILGSEYTDYNLVMATSYGLPIGNGAIRNSFKKLIKEHNLPPVVFHSLRHTSVTYKLKLNGGDIKAVQGDSGHSQINMVTDVYSHIIDDDRRRNAEMFEDAFYNKKDLVADVGVDRPSNLQKNGIVENEEACVWVSTTTGENIDELKSMIANVIPKADVYKAIVADLIKPLDFVVLVVPIDGSAPKGRLILPQQQTIRDILETGAVPVVVKDTELEEILDKLKVKPSLVITDSQVFGKVAQIIPEQPPPPRYHEWSAAAAKSICPSALNHQSAQPILQNPRV